MKNDDSTSFSERPIEQLMEEIAALKYQLSVEKQRYLSLLKQPCKTVQPSGEEYFIPILESIGDAFIACDSNWRIVYLNSAAERLTGSLRQKILGMDCWQAFPVAVGSPIEEKLRQAASGKSGEFEYHYELTGQWFHARVFPRESGGITFYFVDVTGRKATETKLQYSLELIKGITQSTGVMISAVNDDYRHIFFNDAYKQEIKNQWGFDIEVGTSVLEIFAGKHKDQQKAKELWRDALKGESLSIIVEPEPGPNRRFYNTHFSPLYDANGHLIGAGQIMRDVTEEVLNQRALQEKTHLLQSISDNMLDLVSLTDMKGIILFLSASHDILGYGHKTLIGKNVLDLVHHEDLAKIAKAFTEAIINRDDNSKIEYRALCADGSFFWFETVGRFIYDDNEEPVQIVFNSRDITERKQFENALHKLNEELEQKVVDRTKIAETRTKHLQTLAVQLIEAEEKERQRIAKILHDDLQQLIASARMQASMACENPDSAKIIKNVEYLLGISLEKSRHLSYELSPPVLHQFGLVAALKWLIRYMDEQFGLKVKFEEKISHSIKATQTVFLFRAAQELLFNSVKHSGVKNITVNLHSTNNSITLEINDQGKGFNPNILNSIDREIGLGLISLRERAYALDGRFDIKSKPGQGSHFTLIVPIDLELERPEKTTGTPVFIPEIVKQTAISDTEKIRVLFVDDHKVMRQGLIGIISAQPGIEVAGEAACGEEAIQLIRQLRPDVVVMDISMPGMDGVETTRLVKAEMPKVKVIGLSMFSDENITKRMIRAGADGFVNKSESSSKLLKAIYEVAG